MLRTTFSREQPESLNFPIFAHSMVPLSHCQPGIFPLTGDPPLELRKVQKEIPDQWKLVLLSKSDVLATIVEDAEFSRLATEASELWLRVFLELGFTYGWRRGELLGLRCRQVSLTAGTIRLDPGTTKNGEGREVTMTARVATLLRQAVAGRAPEDYVIRRQHGGPVRDFRSSWKGLTKRAGLPGLLVHDMRRSAAKALRKAGVPESVIMATGGWKTG